MSASGNSWDRDDYWDTRFRDEDTPWELGEPCSTIVDLEKRSLLPKGSSVLVPGCGRGEEALHFSRLSYRVSAVDWATAALEDLRVRGRKEDLSLEILRSDFWKIPQSWYQTFDIVVEYTFFCAIDPDMREDYVDQTLKLLRPGGYFLASLFINNDMKERSILEGEGPPFWSTEQEVIDFFQDHFDILELKPSPDPPPARKDWEWSALFKRKIDS